MKRKRWKLVAVWTAVVVLAFVTAGAVVYQAARSAIEKDVQEVYGMLVTEQCPIVGFEGVKFSVESWVILEFDADFDRGSSVALLNNWEFQWGLREWDILPRIFPALPTPTPEYVPP